MRSRRFHILSESQALAGQPQVHTASYGWDDDGRPAALGYPSGLEVAYAYGARGLMSGVSAHGIAVANYTYDADGRRVGKTLGNGAGSTWVYDDASQVLGIGHANGGGVFASREYTYDTTGRRTSMTSRQPGYGPLPDEYLHDPLDQIAGVRYAVSGGVPTRTVDYLHDAVGNRQQVTEDGLATAYSVNDLNQYTAVGGQALSYSTNGNLVAMPGAAFTYDALNRLVSAVNGTNTVAFAYDGRNRCVARTVNGATIWMIWNDWSLIEERDGTGAIQAAYIHGARIDEVLARLSGETALLYHEDALGSVVALTDPAGDLVEQYRYDVYGQPSVFDSAGQPLSASAVGNRFLFTGREWLAELGLYDCRNRLYSPVLGRWLQPDPIGLAAGDVNLYRYCGDNPHNGIDSFGFAVDLNLVDPADPFHMAAPHINSHFSVLVHGPNGPGGGFNSLGPDAPPKPPRPNRHYNRADVANAIFAAGLRQNQDVRLISCNAGAGGDKSNAQMVANLLDALFRSVGGYKGTVYGPTGTITRSNERDMEILGDVKTIIQGRVVSVPGEWKPFQPQR